MNYLKEIPKDFNLKEKMRQVWEQHVFWTRLLIVSITQKLQDEEETTKRLLRNASDFGVLFTPFYGPEVEKAVSKLMTDHLAIGAKLIHAIVNNSPDINDINISWYKNADDIVDALNNVNPHFNIRILRQMLYEHLNLTKEEVVRRLEKNYKKEIEVFDILENEAIMMGDYFTKAIYNQFN